MKCNAIQIPWTWLGRGALLVVVVVAAVSYRSWLPTLQSWIDTSTDALRGTQADAAEDAAESQAQGSTESLHITPQGRQNLGLTDEFLQPVSLQTYRRSITVPAVVVKRPGRTHLDVATPMTAIVEHVHALPGESVRPGQLLFELRLTHEDLVQLQTDFLTALGELDVEQREIARLQVLVDEGAVAGVQLLEHEYARDRLRALLDAQREALHLHGLSDEQVTRISEDRRLLRELRIVTPSPDDHSDHEIQLTNRPDGFVAPVSLQQQGGTESDGQPALILQELLVHKGHAVMAGESLCVLADYQELYIEGLAFEQDAAELTSAAQRGWTATAVFEGPGGSERTLPGLEFAFFSNEVTPESRTLPFYVQLPNEILPVMNDASAQEPDPGFVAWRYRLGQRLELMVPVEEWEDQIVLPSDAVADDGAESYVFLQNGDHFDRVPVHVKHRDGRLVVINYDGSSLFPGDIVALRGAHQMQMAVKNLGGGGVDPHAGHSH